MKILGNLTEWKCSVEMSVGYDMTIYTGSSDIADAIDETIGDAGRDWIEPKSVAHITFTPDEYVAPW